MLCKVKGVVLKSIEYGENDKLLTLLTHEKGKMIVSVKGGRSMKSKHMPSCEMFAYSEYELYEKQGKYWVRESYLCESFFQIRRSLQTMYLGQYLCEVTCEFALFDEPDDALIRLLLNSLYLLSKDTKDLRIIKSVFEMRSASIEGFMPDLSSCTFCFNITDHVFFDAIEGNIICEKCKSKLNRNEEENENAVLNPVMMLDVNLYHALNYVINSPIEKAFSFILPDKELDELSHVCQTYLLHQLERGFKTLDFYNSL